MMSMAPLSFLSKGIKATAQSKPISKSRIVPMLRLRRSLSVAKYQPKSTSNANPKKNKLLGCAVKFSTQAGKAASVGMMGIMGISGLNQEADTGSMEGRGAG